MAMASIVKSAIGVNPENELWRSVGKLSYRCPPTTKPFVEKREPLGGDVSGNTTNGNHEQGALPQEAERRVLLRLTGEVEHGVEFVTVMTAGTGSGSGVRSDVLCAPSMGAVLRGFKSPV